MSQFRALVRFPPILYILIIPFLCGLLIIVMRFASGPFWLGVNSDPSYLYLINSLYYFRGISSHFTDHPGTTLHLLFIVLFTVLNPGKSAEEIINAVLRHPEFYLNAMHVVLAASFLVSLILLGRYAYQKSGSKVFAMLLQCPAFFYLTLKAYDASLVLPIVANINAEPLMLTFINLFAIAFLKIYSSSKFSLGDIILLSLIAAAGLATKFTFAPLILLPLVILKTPKAMLWYGGALTFWFLIFLVPIFDKLGQVQAWLYSVFFPHESSGVSVDWRQAFKVYLLGWKWIIHDQKTFLALTIVVIGIASHSTKLFSRPAFKVAAASLGVALLNLAIVAHHPGPHYLTVGVGALGISFAFFYLGYLELKKKKGKAKDIEQIQKLGIGIVSAFVICGTIDAIIYAATLANKTMERISFYEKVRVKYQDCKLIGYYRSSGPEFALQFGDGTKRVKILGKDLRAIYSDWYFFEQFDYYVADWVDGVPLVRIQEKYPCIYFKGNCANPFARGYLQTERVETGPEECVYRLTGSTESQAKNGIVIAQIMVKAGNYPKAYKAIKRALDHHIFPEHTKPLLKQICPHIGQQDIYGLCQ